MSSVPAWRANARCAEANPESFFPERGETAQSAKQTCLACDVREQCLEWALTNNEPYGVWGGLTEAERRRLKGGKKHYGRTHCRNQHEFTDENTAIDSRGRRQCRTCDRERMRAARARKRAEKKAAEVAA